MVLRTGVYPGTFDPVTNGHLDIISRASKMVDILIVGVAINASKTPFFSLEERIKLLEHEIKNLSLCKESAEIKVLPIKNLLVNFANEMNARTIFRGLRAVSDFDYEFKMSVMNTRLNSKIETVFLMASEQNQFVSSVFVKEIVRLGGDVSSFVPEKINQILIDRLKDKDLDN